MFPCSPKDMGEMRTPLPVSGPGSKQRQLEHEPFFEQEADAADQ